MNKTLFTAVGLALMTASFSAPAEAGPFDKLKSKIKKVEKKAKEVEQTAAEAEAIVESVSGKRGRATTNRRGGVMQYAGQRRPQAAKGLGHAGRAGPAPAKFTSLTKCAGLSIQNAMIGQLGRYTYQDGLQQESLTGLINREQTAPVSGCVMPSLGTGDVLYLEVPAAQLKASGNNFRMQCVDMNTGQNANSAAFPAAHNIAGKDIMLHTGNSAGYTPTHAGSISDRSGAWDKDLKRRGMAMMGFNMPNLHTDSGTDFYCQYYSKETGKSAVAFAYRRSAGA